MELGISRALVVALKPITSRQLQQVHKQKYTTRRVRLQLGVYKAGIKESIYLGDARQT